MAGGPDSGGQVTVPRGRHAPPLDVRLGVQRRRLFQAAAVVFSRVGYAEASAEAISREAGMSKATFYEHFSNKEECIIALFETAATEVMREMANAELETEKTYADHVRAGAHAFVETLAKYPYSTRTLLVEIIGAGPHVAQRRDVILDAFAEALYRDNARCAERFGAPTFATRDDAFAVIGAIAELVSRQLRTGHPDDLQQLEDIIVRLVLGVLTQSPA